MDKRTLIALLFAAGCCWGASAGDKETALTEENVKKLHENGIVINCWTCDDPAAAEKLAAWGVDMITSNILQ